MSTFCILGATGTTGKTIARLLDAESMKLTLAARTLTKLEELNESLKSSHEIKTLDIENYPEVLRAVESASVVINCLGPFTTYGKRVIDACLEAKVHYLDITGEQYFIKSVQEDYQKEAEAACVAIVPSCAFEFALADAGIALMGKELGRLDNVEVTYKFKDITTSRGTNSSVIQALSSPAYLLTNGELEEIKGGLVEGLKDQKLKSRFAFPGGEVFLSPRHTDVGTIKTFLTSPMNVPLVKIVSRLMPLLAKSAKNPLLKIAARSNQSIDEAAQARTSFFIELFASNSDEEKRLSITGMNPYRLSAGIAKNIARALLENENLKGVLSPSMVKDHNLIIDTTKQYGVTWKLH